MYVGHTAAPSGGEIALLRLLPGIISNARVVIVLGEDGPMADRYRSVGAEVLVRPFEEATRGLRKEQLSRPSVIISRLLSVIRYAWLLRSIMRSYRVDVVHTNSLKAGVYGCLAARLAGVPSVWHLRDRLSPDYLPRLAVICMRAVMTILPNRVICNSSATMATLTSGRMGRLIRPAVVVPSPVPDILDWTAEDAGGGQADGSAFTVGMVGRIASWKGQVTVVRAFGAASLPAGSRLVLVGGAMFGEDAYELRIREEISEAGLDGRVDMLGHVDDVLARMRSFDVLVHASLLPEPFGQVIVEGLAAGIPVIATRGGGPEEILTEGRTGLLYDPGDEAALADLLRLVHRDGELRASLSVAGRHRARDFTSTKVAPRVLALYQELQSRGGRKR